MSLRTLWQAVRGRWHDLVQTVWPDSPAERTQAEIAGRTTELERRYRRLLRLRQRMEQLGARLDRQQRQLSEAASRDVDPGKLQRAVERQRERVARLEEGYQQRCRQLQRRKRLRAALMSGQVQVVAVVHGTGESEA